MEQRVRVNDVSQSVATRFVPIEHLLITATSSGAAQTLYTVRDKVMLKLGRLSVVNTSGSAATLTLYAVPSGGAVGTGNMELGAVSIPANSAADLTPYVGGLYKSGATLRVFAGTGSVLVVHGWGEEVL
jgi:hypothetical protein